MNPVKPVVFEIVELKRSNFYGVFCSKSVLFFVSYLILYIDLVFYDLFATILMF